MTRLTLSDAMVSLDAPSRSDLLLTPLDNQDTYRRIPQPPGQYHQFKRD